MGRREPTINGRRGEKTTTTTTTKKEERKKETRVGLKRKSTVRRKLYLAEEIKERKGGTETTKELRREGDMAKTRKINNGPAGRESGGVKGIENDRKKNRARENGTR